MPMRVFKPPRSAAKARGISKREGGRPVRRAMSTTTGSISAATPMSFIKPDSTPTVSMIVAISRASLPPARRNTGRPIRPATPVRASPALRMSTAQTVTTAMLAKPDRASAGVTRPVRVRLTSTMRATTSTRIRSVTNMTMAAARMARTVAISIDMMLVTLQLRWHSIRLYVNHTNARGSGSAISMANLRRARRRCPSP